MPSKVLKNHGIIDQNKKEYILNEDYSKLTQNEINELAIAFYDRFPVTQYHTLIIPKRHVSDYFELYQPELNAIQQLLVKQKEYLQNKDKTITGFNIRINSGVDAGQSIFHVHVHLIPRRTEDIIEPKGEVRGVIPEKQTY